MGDPTTGAPVGSYAIRLFDKLGIGKELKAKLKFATNVSERQMVARQAMLKSAYSD
jgi:ABC-type molybdate transport system substrate-binding protein